MVTGWPVVQGSTHLIGCSTDPIRSPQPCNIKATPISTILLWIRCCSELLHSTTTLRLDDLSLPMCRCAATSRFQLGVRYMLTLALSTTLPRRLQCTRQRRTHHALLPAVRMGQPHPDPIPCRAPTPPALPPRTLAFRVQRHSPLSTANTPLMPLILHTHPRCRVEHLDEALAPPRGREVRNGPTPVFRKPTTSCITNKVSS